MNASSSEVLADSSVKELVRKKRIRDRRFILSFKDRQSYSYHAEGSTSSSSIESLKQILNHIHIPFPDFKKSAPEKILLFKWGMNDADHGSVYVDEQSAKNMIESFAAQGNLIPWDLNHATVRDVPLEQQKTYAASSLLVDDQGIWLDTVWTDDGKRLVESGSFLYFSPSIEGVMRDGIMYPDYLSSVALTSKPRLKNLKPLLMSMGAQSMVTGETQQPSEALLTKIRPIREMHHATSMLMSSLQACMKFYGNTSLPHGGMKTLSDSMLSVLPEWLEIIAEMIEEMDPEGDAMNGNENESKMASYSQAVAPSETQEEEPTALAGHYDDAQELDDVYSLKELCQKITGKTDLDEIKGALLALSHNQIVYQDQVKDVEKSKVALLVEMGIKEGKIPAHERKMFEKMTEKTISAHLSMAIPRPGEVRQDVSISAKDQAMLDSGKVSSQYAMADFDKVKKDFEAISNRLKRGT